VSLHFKTKKLIKIVNYKQDGGKKEFVKDSGEFTVHRRKTQGPRYKVQSWMQRYPEVQQFCCYAML
jgi:hypothetical protein